MARAPRIRPLGLNACCVSVPCTRAFVMRVCTGLFMTVIPVPECRCHQRNWVTRVTWAAGGAGRRPTGVGCAVARASAGAG